MRLIFSIGILFLALALTCSGQSQKVSYTYDDAGRLTNVDYGNGTSIAYTYDKAGNLLSRVVSAASQNSKANSQPNPKPVEQKAAADARRSGSRRGKTTK